MSNPGSKRMDSISKNNMWGSSILQMYLVHAQAQEHSHAFRYTHKYFLNNQYVFCFSLLFHNPKALRHPPTTLQKLLIKSAAASIWLYAIGLSSVLGLQAKSDTASHCLFSEKSHKIFAFFNNWARLSELETCELHIRRGPDSVRHTTWLWQVSDCYEHLTARMDES